MLSALSGYVRCGLALAVLGSSATSWALTIEFKPVAPNVYAYVGETEGRTYNNEALNANFGLVVTPQPVGLRICRATSPYSKKNSMAPPLCCPPNGPPQPTLNWCWVV